MPVYPVRFIDARCREKERERERDPSMSGGECATTPGVVLALIASPISGSGHVDRGIPTSSHRSSPHPLFANCVFINRDRDAGARFYRQVARGWKGSCSFFLSLFQQRDGKVWRCRRVEGETGAGVVFCGEVENGGENRWRRLIARGSFRDTFRDALFCDTCWEKWVFS